MEPGLNERESALRPLRAAEAAVEALRSGPLSAAEAREPVLQVAHAVEKSLRRLLRDDPAAALPVRLSALAPDELRSEEVLAELRQHDRISIELAGSIHELFGLRRRVMDGQSVGSADIALALHVAARLEEEVLEPAELPEEVPAEEALREEGWIEPPAAEAAVELADTRGSRSRAGWIAGVAGLLFLLVAALWWGTRRDDTALEQGIALFDRGEFAESAHHFFRYSQENPEDVTPHLYLARVHRRLGRLEMARSELKRAADLAPRDPAVHRELGYFLLDLRQYDRAVERFRFAVEADPEMRDGWVGLIGALRAAGRHAEAERVRQLAPPTVRAALSSRSGAPSSAQPR